MCSVPPSCSRSPGAQSENLGCPSLVQQGQCWPNQAPCGIDLPQEMVRADNLGVTFSQNAWAAAQQEGCLGCPDRYPTWPSPAVYPKLDIKFQATVGEDPNFAISDTSYLEPMAQDPGPSPNNPGNDPGNNPPVVYTKRKVLPGWPQEPLAMPQGPVAQGPVAQGPVAQGPMASTAPLTETPLELRPIHNKSQAHVFSHMGNALRGIFYDLRNWNESHPDVPGNFWSHLYWVFARDHRGRYLFYLAMSLLVASAIWYIVRVPKMPGVPAAPLVASAPPAPAPAVYNKLI